MSQLWNMRLIISSRTLSAVARRYPATNAHASLGMSSIRDAKRSFTTTTPPNGYVCSKSADNMESLWCSTELHLDANDVSPNVDSPIVPRLQLEVRHENVHTVRFIIREAPGLPQRYTIPPGILPPRQTHDFDPAQRLYDVHVTSESLVISRKDSKQVVWTSNWSELSFKDQYLSISTQLPKEPVIHGLGETVSSLNRPFGVTSLWARDSANSSEENLYAVQPFHMEIRDGQAVGVFLQNSNAMDVELAPGKMTWHVLGGILDFTLLLGPSPIDVIRQYAQFIGMPAMPNYWQLGWSQCRWGYKTVKDAKAVVEGYERAGIPLETIYADIDYMDDYKNFTFHPTNWPKHETRQFVDWLHKRKQRIVAIVDPGIKIEEGLEAYEVGSKMDVWVKSQDGKPFVGKVWPGRVVFPDFLNPSTTKYWTRMLKGWMDEMPVDGVWIDMNEPANFGNGECTEAEDSPNIPFDQQLAQQVTQNETATQYEFFVAAKQDEKPVDQLDSPPFKIHNGGHLQKLDLDVKTLNGSSLHWNGLRHYDVHNLYGAAEVIATYKALQTIKPNQRPMILTRSCFAGSGHYATKWLGDNHSSFESLKASIPGMLAFQLGGFPMIGADIGGFFGHAPLELQKRWQQLGAFYPFARNHNGLDYAPQEPFLDSDLAQIARQSLMVRYALLPYWYTQFYLASMVKGDPVIRALGWTWPKEQYALDCETQFMVGPALMVCPVLEEGRVEREVYFPPGRWYEWESGRKVDGEWLMVSSPVNDGNAPIFVLGGNIVVLQTPLGSGLVTTEACRRMPVQLLIALDDYQSAVGIMYIDDGTTINPELGTNAGVVQFHLRHGKLTCTPIHDCLPPLPVSQIKVFGWGDVNASQYDLKINEPWELELGD